EHLRRARDLARDSLREARRSVQALRPTALLDQSLSEALKSLIQKMTTGTKLRAEFLLQGEARPLSAELEDELLRIGQEVLTNTLRHADATEFKAVLMFDSQELRLEFFDNGRGFDPVSRHDGFGLLGIRERIESRG